MCLNKSKKNEGSETNECLFLKVKKKSEMMYIMNNFVLEACMKNIHPEIQENNQHLCYVET